MASKVVVNTDEIFSMFCNICCETEIDSLKISSDECSEIKNALILLVGHEDILNKAALFLCKPCRDVLTSFVKFKDMCMNNLIRLREMYFNEEFSRKAEKRVESPIHVTDEEKITESNSIVLSNTLVEVSGRKQTAEIKYVSKTYEDKEYVPNYSESKKSGAVEDWEEDVTNKRTLQNLDEETIYISDDDENEVTHDGSSGVIDARKCIQKIEMNESDEEIDVITVDDKHITDIRSRVNNLPIDPFFRDHQKLHKTVAPATRDRRGITTNQPPTTNTNSRKTRLRKRTRYSRYQKGRFGNSPRNRDGYPQRNIHKQREQQRRHDHRNSLHNLSVLVPGVVCRKQVSKVVVLLEAAAYCEQLTKESTFYSRKIAELRRQQICLRTRVSQLQRSLAAES